MRPHEDPTRRDAHLVAERARDKARRLGRAFVTAPVSPELEAAIERVAYQAGVSKAEWMRGALEMRLRAEGGA